MVKGISKQVIVVHSPDPKLFEQAIFILREDAVKEGISEEALLREARSATLTEPVRLFQKGIRYFVCTMAGAAMTGLVWFLQSI